MSIQYGCPLKKGFHLFSIINTRSMMMGRTSIRFMSHLFLSVFHRTLQTRIRELWRKGFVPTTYISQFEINYTHIPYMSRWILFLHMLDVVKESEEERVRWRRLFANLYGFSITDL